MFARFFIDRPIFASSLSIVITLLGAIAMFELPLTQYPPIVPPTVRVQATYPGASAQTVAESIAAPIEQQVNGVENMLYMSSQCTNDGSYLLQVTFKPEVNLNFAQVLVQNRVNLAIPSLPDVVKAIGVTTRKRNPDILLIVSLNSPDGTYDQLYLTNYANIFVKDEIARVDGIADVLLFGGQDYSMRVWVDSNKLAARNLSATDVVNAVAEQNAPIAGGSLGAPPFPGLGMAGPKGVVQALQMPLTVLGRLSEVDQYNQIILKTNDKGGILRVKDVGYSELGAKSGDIVGFLDGKPSINVAVFQLPDANALETADRVRAKMEELEKNFPAGVAHDIIFDTTPFIRESVNEVYKTLGLAVILVALVVLIFLQNWRSALIPLMSVPVAIIGTFAVMAIMGFSINTLTLFGLVLAIGIVVDDAIVVVEAVEHHIEQGMPPRAATYRAMEEVSGPVIAVGCVLSAVFVPCAFISGITGSFFRQFALTIAVSTLISTFNSLTLSPALCAILLRPRGAHQGAISQALNFMLGWFFRLFNFGFKKATAGYTRVVGLALRGSLIVLAIYGGLLALTGWFFLQIPTGYIPSQDRGYVFLSLQLPDATSLEHTVEAVKKLERMAHNRLTDKDLIRSFLGGREDMLDRLAQHQLTEEDQAILERLRKETEVHGVAHTIAVAGQSFVISAFGSNFGQMFIILDDFQDRRDPHLHSDEIAARLKKVGEKLYPDAIVAVFGPPPISGLGTSGGFKYMLEDRGDMGLEELDKQTNNLIAKAKLFNDGSGGPVWKAKKDEYGNAIWEMKTDQDGNTVYEKDKHGKLNPVYKTDQDGHRIPVYETDEDGATIPELDEHGKIVTTGKRFVKGLFTSFRANSPQLLVDVNPDKCALVGVNMVDVYNTLQIYLGSFHVNDFNRFDHTWQVIVQAVGPARHQIEDIYRLKVRSNQNKMVPLGSLIKVKEITGPLLVTRYNMYPAVVISGGTEKDVSSGQGIEAMERISEAELPKEMAFEWTEITYLQQTSGNTAMLIFGLSVVGVFLVLAALYESWSLPLAIILVVPMCLLGSLTGVWLTNADINIFTQVGFVVLVGLASKNAILIVEFAKLKRDAGVDRRTATLEACKLRLRPILMTSFAFIFGVIPLMISEGAGAEMRRLLGTAVFSGMLGVTLFGIFLTPVFFYVIDWLGEQAIFGSPITRRLLIAAAVLLGVASAFAAEALIVAAWMDGMLSLGGAAFLSFGLVVVIALVVVVQMSHIGRPAANDLPLIALLHWRAQRMLKFFSGKNGIRKGPPEK